MEKLQKEKQVTDSYPIVRHIPVIAVRRDKADGINSIADLAASNLRIGMGDPKAIALGRSGEVLLDASGYGDALREKVIVGRPQLNICRCICLTVRWMLRLSAAPMP